MQSLAIAPVVSLYVRLSRGKFPRMPPQARRNIENEWGNIKEVKLTDRQSARRALRGN
jgi:hypothetical protein